MSTNKRSNTSTTTKKALLQKERGDQQRVKRSRFGEGSQSVRSSYFLNDLDTLVPEILDHLPETREGRQ